MSQEQIISMLRDQISALKEYQKEQDDRIMEIVKELKINDKEQDKLINKLYNTVGRMQVRTAMMTSVFSTIGGGIAMLLLKYVFKAF